MKRFIQIFLLTVILISPLRGIYSQVLELQFSSPIHSIVEEYIKKGIKYANDNSFELIIIKIDTPGGLDSSMRSIIKSIIDSEVPVCMYVYPSGGRAASAGFFILMASHISAMAPGTTTGAAHPVMISFTGKDETKKESPMSDKVLNDAVSYIKNLAEKRKRNIELAVKAVKESLSYTDKEALESGLIDFVSENSFELLKKVDGFEIHKLSGESYVLKLKNKTIVKFPMNWREKFLSTIANPQLAYLFMILGMLGLYFEFAHPGAVVPGVLGAIFLLLASLSFQILPINYTGLFLILLGIILFIAEVKVQGFGILGIGGIVSFVLGSIILIDTPVPELSLKFSFIFPVSLFFALLFALIVWLVAKTHRTKVKTGEEGIIGERGKAVEDFSEGKGRVFVHGEWWNAKSEEDISKDDEVIVLKKEGMMLVVKKVEDE